MKDREASIDAPLGIGETNGGETNRKDGYPLLDHPK